MILASWYTNAAQWLLDLEQVRLEPGAPLSLQWQAPPPPWLAAIAAGVLTTAVVFIYRREAGSVRRRALLAGLRVLILAGAAVMLAKPALVLQRDRSEPSSIALLLDTSRSMTVKDLYHAPEAAAWERVLNQNQEPGRDPPSLADLSRFELALAATTAVDAAPLRAMLNKNRLEVFSFGGLASRALILDDPTQLPDAIDALRELSPREFATDLPRAILSALEQTQGRRLAALVVLSDGRSTEPATAGEAIAAALARQIPIHTLPIGSAQSPPDLAVELVSSPETIFLRDSATLRLMITPRELNGPATTVLETVDDEREALVATQSVTVDPGETAKAVELRFKPDRPGTIPITLRLQPLDGEANVQNNVVRTLLQVTQDRLSVLYVEGYPRYEYRFLKNTLLREPTIRSSCLLLSADPQFPQEGTDPVRRFPETEDQLFAYDVLLLGDVDPGGDWLSPQQADMIVRFVGERGGGFGLIAGTRHAPASFRGTPLEKLVPVQLQALPSTDPTATLRTGFQPVITAEGLRSGVFPTDSLPDGAANDAHTLPTVFWYAPTGGPKPAAEVLAVHPLPQQANEPVPLFVLGRYGAGRLFYAATDDTWRWRRGSNEWLFDSYWLQVFRLLAKPRDVATERRYLLHTDAPRYPLGQRVEVQAELLDPELIPTVAASGSIIARDRLGQPAARIPLTRLGETSNLFEGHFVPGRSGPYTLHLEQIAPAPGRRLPFAAIQVEEDDAELRHSSADGATLQRLTSETGGTLIRPDEFADLAASIPDRSLRIPDDIAEPLWDSKLAWSAILLLLLIEWILRKVFGML